MDEYNCNPYAFTNFCVKKNHSILLCGINNFIINNCSPLTNMYWDHFQETPPMSSYLVAFFVGDFYAIKTPTVGVYTHKSYIGQTVYIANKAAKLLEAMENFTGVDYMMPKIDLLAVPDFSIGAMENWGLNTYR